MISFEIKNETSSKIKLIFLFIHFLFQKCHNQKPKTQQKKNNKINKRNFQTCCTEYESRFNVYRQWIEHSNVNNNNNTNANTNNTQVASATATLNNVVQQQQQQLQQQLQHQQQQQQHQQQQQAVNNYVTSKSDKTFQLIG